MTCQARCQGQPNKRFVICKPRLLFERPSAIAPVVHDPSARKGTLCDFYAQLVGLLALSLWLYLWDSCGAAASSCSAKAGRLGVWSHPVVFIQPPSQSAPPPSQPAKQHTFQHVSAIRANHATNQTASQVNTHFKQEHIEPEFLCRRSRNRDKNDCTTCSETHVVQMWVWLTNKERGLRRF